MSESHRIDLPPPPRRILLWVSFFIALVALVLSGWQLYRHEQELAALRQERSRYLSEVATAQRTIKQLSNDSLVANRTTNGRLMLLEERLSQKSTECDTLHTMYQELTRDRSDWLLPEIEYTLTIANQQLQLASNVSMAIVALEYLTKRLARADKPQLIGVRKAVTHDLNALKTFPKFDTVELSIKLDSLIENIDKLPLAVDMNRADSPTVVYPVNNPSVWKSLLFDLMQSLGELVRIRRMDKPDAVLLSPEQSLLLRENLKIRLLDARLAVMQRDGARFNRDISAARDYVLRYYDGQATLTQQWLTLLSQVGRVPLNLSLPDLATSLKVVRDAQGAGL